MTFPNLRWRNAALWGVLAAGLPAACLAAVSHANEYRSWGGSGVDCDGPMLVMFAYPAAVVYSFGALVFIRRAIRRFRWGSAGAALLCLAIVAGMAAKIRDANREARDPEYQQVCEERWRETAVS